MENKKYKNYTIEKIADLDIIPLSGMIADLRNTSDAYVTNIEHIYDEYVVKVKPKRELLKITHSEDNKVDMLTIVKSIWEHCGICGLFCEIIKNLKELDNNAINDYLKRIKGINDNQSAITKAIKLINHCRGIDSDSMLDRVLNHVNMNYGKSEIYYLYSNDIFDILTASYSRNIKSCYNIDGGAYNNSLTYIVNDNLHNNCKWYVLKEIKDSSTIESLTDPEQLYELTLSRRFITTDNDNEIQLLGSNYGMDRRINENDLKYIMWLYNHDNIENVVENDTKFDYHNCSEDYIFAYEDYKHNESNTLSIENTHNYLDLWNLDHGLISPVSHQGDPLICAECGEIIEDEEEAIYINGEYYCPNCTYYCECCDNYFVRGDGIEVDNHYYCNNCINHI